MATALSSPDFQPEMARIFGHSDYCRFEWFVRITDSIQGPHVQFYGALSPSTPYGERRSCNKFVENLSRTLLNGIDQTMNLSIVET